MDIYAKIGTGPQVRIRVKSIRKIPTKDQCIEFKELPIRSGEKWKRGYVDGTKNVGGYILYYISL